MHLARRSLPVSREYRHQAKPDAEIGMWLCLVLIFARDMERPKCRVHVHGHARHFPARSVIDHDPIVISVCLQMPTDTILTDVLAWVHRAQQQFYWKTRDIIATVWDHMRNEMWNDIRLGLIIGASSRCGLGARTGQPGGLGN